MSPALVGCVLHAYFCTIDSLVGVAGSISRFAAVADTVFSEIWCISAGSMVPSSSARTVPADSYVT